MNSWDELRLGSTGGCDLSLGLDWEEQLKVEFLIEVRVLNIFEFSYLMWFKNLEAWLKFFKLWFKFLAYWFKFLKFETKGWIMGVIVCLTLLLMFIGC